MEGKVFSAECESPVKSSSASEKNMSVAELEQAISDVHKVLQVVSEQVSIVYLHTSVLLHCSLPYLTLPAGWVAA